MKVSDAGQVGGTHYQAETQPIDLMDVMQPSGNVFVDFARGSIIKYAARKKGDDRQMAEDLRKVAHYATLAAQRLDALAASKQQAANKPERCGRCQSMVFMNGNTCPVCNTSRMDVDEARAHIQK